MTSKQTKRLFWVSMIVAQAGAFVIFKDLADISQWVVQSPREFTMAVWYNRYVITAVAVVALVIACWLWFRNRDVCHRAILAVLVGVFAINMYSGMLNVTWMFRPLQDAGTFLLDRRSRAAHGAQPRVRAIRQGRLRERRRHRGARRRRRRHGAVAYSDYYLLQPHVVDAGTVNGEDVVMTYCGLTNLGVAYSPVIDDQPLNLRAITQLKNNLVLADENTGEPIQQLWGHLEGAPERGRMNEIATVRMPFGSYRALFPDGKVFVNEIAAFSDNPVLAVWDRIVRHGMMLWGVGLQWNNPDKAAFPSIEQHDDRLPMKELVYTVSVGDDHVAYTKAFIEAEGGVINTAIGGRPVVVTYDRELDVVAAFFNASGGPVASVDVFGRTGGGQRLERVNTLKSKIFWFIFAEFYPNAGVNRV